MNRADVTGELVSELITDHPAVDLDTSELHAARLRLRCALAEGGHAVDT